MALILVLDQDQIFQGQQTLYRGDDWTVRAKVQNNIGGINTDYDLTGASVTGFFPAASGGAFGITGQVTDAKCGSVAVQVPAAVTPNLALADSPIPWYITVQEQAGDTFTASTVNPMIGIVDRNFGS